MRIRNTFICSVSVLAALCSCKGGSTGTARKQGDTLQLRHAHHLTIVSHEDFTEVSLADPWNTGKVLQRYLLVPSSAQMPEGLPEGTVVRTPLQRAVVATSVHCGLIDDLGHRENIVGICELQYVNIPWIKQQCLTGKISDCGSGLSPTVEKIIEVKPDAIFLSPFQNSGGFGRVEELGVPIIQMADYMETSALGRAEWMRFYGLLFGAGRQADSIFSVIEQRYNSLTALIPHRSSTAQHPSILMDKQTGSVWYVPGGKSTIGRIIADAGISYAWADDDHSGSLALPFERVLEKAGEADVWLFRYNSPQPATLRALLSEKQGYSQFRAFRHGKVYGCNTATSTFYEDTPFHPDLLLRDFITIVHPQLNMGEPKYFQKLAP